jgi:hypothetical protein
VFFEFRFREWGRVESGKRLPCGKSFGLSPFPLFPIKLCGFPKVHQLIIAALSHFSSGFGPTRSRGPCRPNEDASGFDFQFDFVGELGFLDYSLW